MSAEGPKLAKALCEKYGSSPTDIAQTAVVLKNKKELFAVYIKDEQRKKELQEEIKQLENNLKKVIEAYGGLAVINAWLIKHEAHYETDDLYLFDWSFLKN